MNANEALGQIQKRWFIEQDGQSILEFLFMLPTLLGLTALMLRVNTAIQISIVDQQYARAQALGLAAHQAIYPSLIKQQRLIETSTNQLIVGVSENPPSSEEETYVPKASTQWVGTGRNKEGEGAPHEEPPLRGNVRVRNTVTLCTPSLSVSANGKSVPLLAVNSRLVAVLPVALGEGTKLSDYCGSPIKYEQ